MDKQTVYNELPIKTDIFTIRKRVRGDLDELSGWPPYPGPFQVFNFHLTTKDEKDKRFARYESNPELIILSAEHPQNGLVGTFSLRDIEWADMRIKNIGIRMHPDWCGKGHGSGILSGIVSWLSAMGFKSLRMDVSKENIRAVRAYEKAGFEITGEVKCGNNMHWLMEKSIQQ